MHKLHGHVFCKAFILSHLLQLNGGLSNLVDWEAGRRISGSIGFVFFTVLNSSMALRTDSLPFLFCTCSCWPVGLCHAADLMLWNNLSWDRCVWGWGIFFSFCFPPISSFLILIRHLILWNSYLGDCRLSRFASLKVCYVKETMGCQRCSMVEFQASSVNSFLQLCFLGSIDEEDFVCTAADLRVFVGIWFCRRFGEVENAS